jgi:hypothetical protein
LSDELANDSENWPTMPQYITSRLKELGGRKTLETIAIESGYVHARMITRFAKGELRVPLDRTLLLAHALEAPVVWFFRLAMAQFGAEMTDLADAICYRIKNENEETLHYEIRRVTASAPSADGSLTKPTFSGPTTELNFTVPLELHRRFTVEAAMRGLSVNELLMLSFQFYLAFRERSA